MSAPRGYRAVKAMAKRLGCRISDLLVLARANDPFFCGGPADQERARWFASIWEQFDYTEGVHLRRIHYRALSLGIRMLNGEPYTNTERCWKWLCQAAANARTLGYVPAEAFVDRKNAQPIINSGASNAGKPTWKWRRPTWSLPQLSIDLDCVPVLSVGLVCEGLRLGRA